jgi:phospholipid/cholesterol/gamma-HCH transport system substrate-binding protein
MSGRTWGALGLAAAVVAVGVVAIDLDDGYEVQFVMPSAAQLAEGSPVWIDGADAGSVTDLRVENGRAVVTASIADEHAPLHDGTTTRVEWSSAIGERLLTVEPGPQENVELQDRALVEAPSRQIEVDQVLAMLDGPTRERVSSLVEELNTTVSGSEDQLRATIKESGYAVNALGSVLDAVGKDGPAIRSLVTELDNLTSITSEHQSQTASSVQQLTTLTSSIADQQEALSSTLQQLPSTLSVANSTLGRVPAASRETVALLQDLEPATDRLPGVTKNLTPVLRDLRPTVADLRPLLASASELLERTPGLLEGAQAVVPDVDTLLQGLTPALSFLRPYTPEGIGMLHNWGQAFAPYDGRGHVWAGMLAPGTNAVDESLIRLPGAAANPSPLPGQVVDQPWRDATGSGIR